MVLKLHTQRLSRFILVGVALFVVAIATVLVVRGWVARIQKAEVALTKADYRIKQVHLEEEARGGVRWQLDADQAEAYEQLGKTTLRKVRIRIQEPERSWTVTGDEGELAHRTKDVELRGNVVLVSSDGLRLETARLRWDAARQRAWSDDPVTLFRQGAVIRGQGLDASVGGHTEIMGRVRATLGERAGAPPATAGAGVPR
ncbi:MAG: LPS export ABC transporter periplasmic protein LptC [Candidatus Rokubacteria bacterium]|nr:LPS export ABC transporter periplasmic protein LptC [Candidatus Rokubacteria bacterium]